MLCFTGHCVLCLTGHCVCCVWSLHVFMFDQSLHAFCVSGQYMQYVSPVTVCCGQLSTDQVYVTAVNNIVHKHLEAAKRTRHSQCESASPEGAVDASFLDTVHSFLCNITDVQLAVGCSNWVVKELPLGQSHNTVNSLEQHKIMYFSC